MVAQLKKLTDVLKYTPPNFESFERYGEGLFDTLTHASAKLSLAKKAMYGVRLEDYPTWKSHGGRYRDLISVYGYWAKTADVLLCLNFMNQNERKIHIDLASRKPPYKPSFTWAKIQFSRLSREIAEWEISHHEIVYTTLNRQLCERLDIWEQCLDKVEKDPTLLDGPDLGRDLNSISDYRNERSILEYAKDGITCLRMMGFSKPTEFDRLEPLPYFETYEKRLEELDIRFKKIARRRRRITPWANPTHWWYQPKSEHEGKTETQLKKAITSLKYTPPNFQLFEQYGSGLLEIARHATMNLSLIRNIIQNTDTQDYPSWKGFGGQHRDLVSVYGYWAKATDILMRLNFMDPDERKKHIEFDTQNFPDEPTFEQIKIRFAELSDEIDVWETAIYDYKYATLNRHLRERLDAWEQHISFAEENPTLFDQPSSNELNPYSDYCDERTLLEYARDGITCLRKIGFSEHNSFKRLKPISYFETYEQRLEELDIRFRKILHNHHCVAPWADPAYWWHQPE